MRIQKAIAIVIAFVAMGLGTACQIIAGLGGEVPLAPDGGQACSQPADCPQGTACKTAACMGGQWGFVKVHGGSVCMTAGYACDTTGACTCPAENQCGAACVDTQTDPNNCGACGHACAVGAMCSKGSCACVVA